MNNIRKLASEVRKLGFIDDLPHCRKTHGCPSAMCFNLNVGNHFLRLQLWGDGNHNVSHGNLNKYGQSSNIENHGVGTSFRNIEDMLRSIAQELIKAGQLK